MSSSFNPYLRQHQHHTPLLSIAISVMVEDLKPQAKLLLEMHNCKFIPAGGKRTIILYPHSTNRQMVRTDDTATRYRIYFPDNFKLREVANVGKATRELYAEKEYTGFLDSEEEN
jgi:hypothetical protein